MTLDHYRPVDEIISYLEEVNFLRFSIVGLAHDVIASISPLLKCTSTSSSMPDDSWSNLARNNTLLLMALLSEFHFSFKQMFCHVWLNTSPNVDCLTGIHSGTVESARQPQRCTFHRGTADIIWAHLSKPQNEREWVKIERNFASEEARNAGGNFTSPLSSSPVQSAAYTHSFDEFCTAARFRSAVHSVYSVLCVCLSAWKLTETLLSNKSSL